MATTLRIDERLYRDAKASAARDGVTITQYIEAALRLKMASTKSAVAARPIELPTFAAGSGFAYSPRKLRKLIQQTDSKADLAEEQAARRPRRHAG